MLVDSGNLGIRILLASYITQIGYGSAGNAPASTDIGLTDQVLKPVTSTANLSNGRILFSGQVAPTDPPMTVLEVGLFNASGTLLFRTLCAPFNKVAGVSNTVEYELTLS